MMCAGCVTAVEDALSDVPGVEKVQVNLVERTAQVEGNAAVSALIEAVGKAGYAAAQLRGLADETDKAAAEFAHYRRLLRRALVAGLVAVPLLVGACSGH